MDDESTVRRLFDEKIAREATNEALDNLSDNPTEEEAEAVLQACGTSGKEVVNEFIERLLKENLGLKQELARRVAVAGPQGDESGWLLEKTHEGNVHYICADYVLQWTDDPNKALRLARREDAEALTTIVEDCEKIASHEWPAATSSPARIPSDFITATGELKDWNTITETRNRDKAQKIILATEAALGEKFDSIARHELVNRITVALNGTAPADNEAESKGKSDA